MRKIYLAFFAPLIFLGCDVNKNSYVFLPTKSFSAESNYVSFKGALKDTAKNSKRLEAIDLVCVKDGQLCRAEFVKLHEPTSFGYRSMSMDDKDFSVEVWRKDKVILKSITQFCKSVMVEIDPIKETVQVYEKYNKETRIPDCTNIEYESFELVDGFNYVSELMVKDQ